MNNTEKLIMPDDGIFDNVISNEDYHDNRTHISSSGIKLMLKDPRQFYKQYVLNEEGSGPTGPALAIGSYLHCMILEPHLLDVEFAIYPGAQRRGKVYEEFAKENQDKTILTLSQDRHVRTLVDNFNGSKIIIGNHGNEKEVMINSFFTKGKPEESLFGELEGIKTKVRFDYRKEWEDYGSINDLKTTGDYCSSKEEAENICAKWGYDVSAALYVDMVEKYTGKPHDFYFTIISKKTLTTHIYKASKQMIESGRAKYIEGLRRIKLARETGIYFENRIEEINSL